MSMIDENNGWGRATGLGERGRHATFASSVDAALKELLVVHTPFYDALVDNWRRLFPSEPAKPGRFEDGVLYLYVTKATTSYLMRSRLPKIKKALLALPDAPAKLTIRVEIHSA